MNKFNFEGKRVLIVEDNKLNIEIAGVLLSMCKITCETANNGEEAIERFSNSSEGFFSAILTDIQMPVMDGNSMVKTIRELNRSDAKTIPIIAMTASNEDESITYASCNFNEQISKPIDPGVLFHILAKYL